jgi:hypothetical protein
MVAVVHDKVWDLPRHTQAAMCEVGKFTPVGSTVRRDLGRSLRSLRLQTGQTRPQVATTLGWPRTRIELIETGRIKVDHQQVAALAATYSQRHLHGPPNRQPSRRPSLGRIRTT